MGLVGVFLLMLGESACLPIPSEATMLFAGFNVAEGEYSLLLATFVGVAANVIGSWIAYGVGYFGRAAVSGGVMALFGRRHRLVLDLMASPAAADGGTGRRTNVYYALSLLAGWEWMTYDGVAIRSTLGVGVALDGDEVFFAANPLSVVFKFW